nr:MAG TPA: hypothetical protein [Caudoviricetes sp.]
MQTKIYRLSFFTFDSVSFVSIALCSAQIQIVLYRKVSS